MDALTQDEQDEIVRAFNERAEAIAGDFNQIRRIIDERFTSGRRDEIREMIDAGNARAPIRAEVEAALQACEKRISEQRKLIDAIRQAMTQEG